MAIQRKQNTGALYRGDPGHDAVVITPSDTVLAKPIKYLFWFNATAADFITVTLKSGNNLAVVGIPAGAGNFPPLIITHVLTTATTFGGTLYGVIADGPDGIVQE